MSLQDFSWEKDLKLKLIIADNMPRSSNCSKICAGSIMNVFFVHGPKSCICECILLTQGSGAIIQRSQYIRWSAGFKPSVFRQLSQIFSL